MGRAGPGYETMEERGDVPMGIFLTAAKGRFVLPKWRRKCPSREKPIDLRKGTVWASIIRGLDL